MPGVLVRRGDLDTDGYRRKTMGRRKEKAAIYKLWREVSGDPTLPAP